MSGFKKKDNKSYNKVSQNSFNENDRRQLNDILNTVKNFADEIQELRKELDVVKMENHLLKQAGAARSEGCEGCSLPSLSPPYFFF